MSVQPLGKVAGVRPIIPQSYGDALSYMEAINKLADKVNEVVDTVNGLIVQTTGQNTDKVMSQKAVTDELQELQNEVNTLRLALQTAGVINNDRKG